MKSPSGERTAKDYQRMTVKEVAELHGVDEDLAESIRNALIIDHGLRGLYRDQSPR